MKRKEIGSWGIQKKLEMNEKKDRRLRQMANNKRRVLNMDGEACAFGRGRAQVMRYQRGLRRRLMSHI